MNLKKVIEVTTSLLDGTYDHRDEEMEDALRLSIEALKREQQFRKVVKPRDIELLPGETED